MKKVIFVVPRFGTEVNGGAEVHCKMLAKKMASKYEIEVLTTCLNNYSTLENFYITGVEILDGIQIRRFETLMYNKDRHEELRKKAAKARKIRRTLFRLGASFLFNFFPQWQLQDQDEYNMIKNNGFHSEDLIHYLEKEEENCAAIIVMSYSFPTTHMASQVAPQKTILIPMAHEESMLFHSICSQLFSRVAFVAFNSITEQLLCKKLFRRGLAKNGVVSVGTDLASPADYNTVKNKYNLPHEYILYFGRVCYSKLEKLIPYFTAYKEKYAGNIHLVMVGGLFIDPIPQHPYIHYTGFVTESEKTAIIRQARLVVNPSRNESLSLLLLEAMTLEKLVIVNSKCAVMLEHYKKSDQAIAYYDSKNSFCDTLNHYLTNPLSLEKKVLKAKKYIDQNFGWDIVLRRMNYIIEELTLVPN